MACKPLAASFFTTGTNAATKTTLSTNAEPSAEIATIAGTKVPILCPMCRAKPLAISSVTCVCSSVPATAKSMRKNNSVHQSTSRST